MPQDSENRPVPPQFGPDTNEQPGFRPSSAGSGSEAVSGPEKPTMAIAIVICLSLAAIALVVLPPLLKSDAAPYESSASQAQSELVSNTFDTDTDTDTDINEAVATVSSTNQAPTPAPAEPVAESPWADSQLQEARRESQEVLAELLNVQKDLTRLRAEEWASITQEEIQAFAEDGDQAYRNRSYAEAIELYKSALSVAQQLVDSSPATALEYLALGSTSLEKNDLDDAINSLELATTLDPNLVEAKQMLDQAQVRGRVLQLENTALKHLQNDMLEDALEAYISIQALDAAYAGISDQIDKTNTKIRDRDFRQAMSAGFNSLSNRNLSAAESAFNRAGALKPNNDAVAEALQQVEASRINGVRQTKLDNAIALEAEERWSEALSIYDSLLNEDETLTSAQLGRLRSDARSKLDVEIQNILDEPLSLQSEQRWQQANRVLIEAKNVIDRGPVLDSQITQLDSAVRVARTEVTLALFSDSQTSVEIYRMGSLGQFREHAVALYPGRYVLVGTRSGYRDVREELVLDGRESRVELNIRCTESI